MRRTKATKSDAGRKGGNATKTKHGLEHFSQMGRIAQQRLRDKLPSDYLRGGELWVPGRYRRWLLDMIEQTEDSDARAYFSYHISRMWEVEDKKMKKI